MNILEFFFNTAAAAKSIQSCPTLCDPTDGSPPGSPVAGILQARTLEWVAFAFSIFNTNQFFKILSSDIRKENIGSKVKN